MQHQSETNTLQNQREHKDYLYINFWSFLALIGTIIGLVINIFYQSIDADTFILLGVIAIFLIGGSIVCVPRALKKGARQTRILGVYSFFLTILAVSIGVIAVYDNKKPVVILSLLLTIPISLLSMLPLFYYGDYREHEPLSERIAQEEKELP